MKIHLDDSELRNLELDIRGASGRLQRNATPVLRRAGRLLDRGMRDDAEGHQGNYFGIVGTEFDTPLEDHVSHELLDAWTLEVGIENKGAGQLAHIIVYGSVNNEPVYDHTTVLRRNTARIVAMFGDVVEDSVLGEGGGDHT